jgi:hypothetical protein
MARIPRGAYVALGVYVALLATLATPLYDPFESGEDDSWVIFVLLWTAHVGLGAAVARPWVLMVPVIAAIVGFLATGGEALSWLIPIYGLPIALVLTAIGWAAGRLLKRRALPVAAGVFALAAAPAAWAGVETIKRSSAPHVPENVQKQLPTDISLGNLCPAETSRRLRRDVEQRAEVLLRELRREPDALVTFTYYWAEGGEERRDITVRELAEEQLGDLHTGGRDCAPQLQRRIEAVLR